MAPRKNAASASDGVEGAPQSLTDTELRFIKAVFDNMTQKPDANWINVAQTLGLKDAKCAKERWRQMSLRHGWREGGGASVAGSGAGGSPRKGGADSSGVVAGDAKVTKKPRTPRKKKAIKQEESEESKDDEVADAAAAGSAGDAGGADAPTEAEEMEVKQEEQEFNNDNKPAAAAADDNTDNAEI